MITKNLIASRIWPFLLKCLKKQLYSIGSQLPIIQEMLGDAVNSLVKHFYKPVREVGMQRFYPAIGMVPTNYAHLYTMCSLTGIDINSIREMCSDACNNLVKHFNKPEKEVTRSRCWLLEVCCYHFVPSVSVFRLLTRNPFASFPGRWWLGCFIMSDVG